MGGAGAVRATGAAAVAAVAEPAGDGGHQVLADGVEEDVVADAVELDEDGAGAGRAGRQGPAAAVGQTVQAAPVRVVVPDGEGGAGGGRHGGHHGGDDDGGLGGGLAVAGGDETQGHDQQ